MLESRDANGNVVDAPFRRTIKESYRQVHKSPEGALAATFACQRALAVGSNEAMRGALSCATLRTARRLIRR